MIKTALMTAALALSTAGAMAGSGGGHLDEGFGFAGTVTTDFGSLRDAATAVATQADGKIVVAGTSDRNIAVARYNGDGSLDAAFGEGGKVTTPAGKRADARAVAIQPDGKILVAGSRSDDRKNLDFALLRYDASGKPDAGFGTDGVITTDLGTPVDLARGLTVQADGKILVCGDSGALLAVARYDASGALDPGFGTGGKATTAIGKTARGYAVAVQGDGKVVVAGSQNDQAQGINFAVVRYDASGKPDTGFGKNGVATSNFGSPADVGRGLAIQKDGKIVVAGYSGKSIGLARYTAEGVLDPAFSTDGMVTTAVGTRAKGEGVAIQPDGKIVVAGAEDNPAQGTNFAVVRYGADGSLDRGFGSGGVCTGNFGSPVDQGQAVALQADGKIVVAGTSTHPVLGVNFAVARFLAE